MVNGFAALFLPALCQSCEAPADSTGFCADCIALLPWNRISCPRCALPQSHTAACADCARQAPPYDRAWCPLRMEGPVRTAVHDLKYRAKFLRGHALGGLMAEQLMRRADPLPQRLIPVPLHPSRLMRRGYNQALELARRIVRHIDIGLSPEAARRIRHSEQVGADAAQRHQNMRGAFRITDDLCGLHVAVLDDVMTTGATLAELARACREAGAAKVEVWAAARAP